MIVASVWTQTPGQSLESAVLVIVSSRPETVMFLRVMYDDRHKSVYDS